MKDKSKPPNTGSKITGRIVISNDKQEATETKATTDKDETTTEAITTTTEETTKVTAQTKEKSTRKSARFYGYLLGADW
ncbi:hypothetical protein [Bacteroides nordii]|uniref:hypothetical protein n=1 Tax=Bacteroides nordii TaxID=291645 RepID=UPI0002F03B5C|nr:hypothetical protein [Bacteroides nordii]MCG4771038.1 hypothetical protein [Bacteroides nordii]GFZ39571.1 hypothetical protein BANORC5_16060 [Bacteroides nordii]